MRYSSRAAYCPVSPIGRRTEAAWLDHVVAEHACLAAVRAQQSGEHPDGGGLARPVRAEQP